MNAYNSFPLNWGWTRYLSWYSTNRSSEPDRSNDNDDQSNDHSVTNGTNKGSSSNSVSAENDKRALGLARTSVILGAVSLIGFLLVSVAFVSHIFCKKQSKIRKRMGRVE